MKDPESNNGRPMDRKLGESMRLAVLRAYWEQAPVRSLRAATNDELRELALFVAASDLTFAKRLCNALYVEAKIRSQKAGEPVHTGQMEAFK